METSDVRGFPVGDNKDNISCSSLASPHAVENLLQAVLQAKQKRLHVKKVIEHTVVRIEQRFGILHELAVAETVESSTAVGSILQNGFVVNANRPLSDNWRVKDASMRVLALRPMRSRSEGSATSARLIALKRLNLPMELLVHTLH